MTDLDERIISILHNYKQGDIRSYPVGKAKSDIKEAFTDCNWHEAPEGTTHSYKQTGAEWYTRFELNITLYTWSEKDLAKILQEASIAARLQEDNIRRLNNGI